MSDSMRMLAARIAAALVVPTLLAPSLVAQTAGDAAVEPLGTPVGEASGAPAGVSAFGLSGSIRVVLAETGAPLDPALLASAGEGWEGAHRWIEIHGPLEPLAAAEAAPAPAPRVLGEPVAVAGLDEAPQGEAEPDGDPPPPWTAGRVVAPPAAGVWRLESASGSEVTVLARVPAAHGRNGILNGYRMGRYPTDGSGRADAYAPPTAFVEVTPESQAFNVSEHLRLGQFLTKDQFDVWPKYVALDLRLIDKLELVVDELNAMGIRADHVHVMSGFRTPSYNGPGGDGRASLSRHMWGDAADVWIDNDRNGLMDDLNGDGSIDLDDAAVMMRAVDRVERKYPQLVGGAETYPMTDTHGPYIHIDARGQRSRW